MQIASELTNLSQFVRNLRFKLSEEPPDTTEWGRLAMEKFQLSAHQARVALEGEEELPPEQLSRIAQLCGVSLEDMATAPLYPADPEGMARANIAFLLSSLGHGGKAQLAKRLGLRPEQLSRWGSGKQIPHAANQRELLRYFALDPDTNLSEVPLFLVNYPIHGEARKKWLINAIQAMPPDKLDPHFASIRKLLAPE